MTKRIVAVCACLLSVACGGGGESPTGPSPTTTSTPTPSFQTLHYNRMVPGSGYYLQDVNVLANVRLRATISWSDASKDIDLHWTNSLCNIDPVSGTFVGAGCSVVARSISSTGNREVVTGDASAGQTVRLWILNYARSPESVSLEVAAQ